METRVTKLFNIDYPIIQAGMVWVSGWKLAVAVAKAGALGLIGAGSMTPELLREHIRKAKVACPDKSWGVNLPIFFKFADEMVKVILEEKIRIVFTSGGSPKKFTGRFKDRSITYRATKSKDDEFDDMPAEIVAALEVALELATRNVPAFEGLNVVLCPDVSGSMSSSPVTGHRKGSTTQVKSIDVAGLIASCLLRMNPLARVLPFEGRVVNVKLDAKNKVMANTKVLSSVGGGSTDCAQPLAHLNNEGAKVDVVIFVSDYESWTGYHGITGATQMQGQWDLLKIRNPNAKLVCLDLAPHDTNQVVTRSDTFGIGGFSDQVFNMINDFVTGSGKNQWIDVVNQVEL